MFDSGGALFSVATWYFADPREAASDNFDEIFSPNAAAAMYRRDAYLQLGGFDEDFGTYHEDVDLGFRLRLLGYRCYYVPDAIIHHIGSASTGVARSMNSTAPAASPNNGGKEVILLIAPCPSGDGAALGVGAAPTILSDVGVPNKLWQR